MAAMTSSTATSRPGALRVLRDQRKTLIVAGVLMSASLWMLVPLGKAPIGAGLAVGVLLGLLNHLYTEFWLLKIISSGANPSRNQMAVSTAVRLLVLTVVAVVIAVVFWPDGIGVLLGLAIFRLIALVMTSIPLLKELRKA
jgi:ATP synthase I chain